MYNFSHLENSTKTNSVRNCKRLPILNEFPHIEWELHKKYVIYDSVKFGRLNYHFSVLSIATEHFQFIEWIQKLWFYP